MSAPNRFHVRGVDVRGPTLLTEADLLADIKGRMTNLLADLHGVPDDGPVLVRVDAVGPTFPLGDYFALLDARDADRVFAEALSSPTFSVGRLDEEGLGEPRAFDAFDGDKARAFLRGNHGRALRVLSAWPGPGQADALQITIFLPAQRERPRAYQEDDLQSAGLVHDG